MTLRRRAFLGLVSLPFAGIAEEPVAFSDYPSDFHTDLQATGPRVKIFDLRALTTQETPADAFFTFHQTTTPKPQDINAWRLEISGAVAKPQSFTYAELQKFSTQQLPAVIECAGNSGKSPLMNGLVSNGVWAGAALAPLLRQCGVLPEAREVVFFGADVEQERKWPAGDRTLEAPHGRSLFVQDAMESSAILATRLNGQPLSPDHGYPLRLIVPGWYGMAQVKWLNRILVLDRRYEGRHMARNYHSIRDVSGLIVESSISRNKLKSVVARIVEAKKEGFRISGVAWGGAHPIDRVQVRIDGQPWRDASIVNTGGPDAWSLWEAPWNDASPGTHTLVSRAIDSRGVMQPERSEYLSSREDNSQWPRQVVVSRGSGA